MKGEVYNPFPGPRGEKDRKVSAAFRLGLALAVSATLIRIGTTQHSLNAGGDKIFQAANKGNDSSYEELVSSLERYIEETKERSLRGPQNSTILEERGEQLEKLFATAQMLSLPTGTKDITSAPSFVVPEKPDLEAAQRVAEAIVMKPDNNNKTHASPISECPVTAEIRIIQSSPHWILQSLDDHGHFKTVGGDEFYITFTDRNSTDMEHSTLVAISQDQLDGTYPLEIVAPPIHPHRTCWTWQADRIFPVYVRDWNNAHVVKG